MTVQEARWLEDAYDLIFFYNRSSVIRDSVNLSLQYKQHPVFFYIGTLVRFSLQSGRDNYYKHYRNVFQRTNISFSNRLARDTWGESLPARISNFLQKCEADTGELKRVFETITHPLKAPSLFTEAERRRLAQAERLPPAQRDLVPDLLGKVAKAVKKSQTKAEELEQGKLYSRIQKYKKELLSINDTEEGVRAKERLIALGRFTRDELLVIQRLGLVQNLEKAKSFQERQLWKQSVQGVSKALFIATERTNAPAKTETVIPETQPIIEEPTAQPTQKPGLPRPSSIPFQRAINLPGAAGGVSKFLIRGPLLWSGAALAFMLFMPIFLSMINAGSLMPPWQDVGLAAPVSPGPTPTPPKPVAGAGIFGCPVSGGRIIYGSKEVGGHCGSDYGYTCIQPRQPGYTGRDTAVDVSGSNRIVSLPNLGGKNVQWIIDELGTSINLSEGGGIAVGAKTTHQGHTYRIRFVHLESTNLAADQKVASGVVVGQHVIPTQERPKNANHIHITLQEDGSFKPADLYFKLCQ